MTEACIYHLRGDGERTKVLVAKFIANLSCGKEYGEKLTGLRSKLAAARYRDWQEARTNG
jgi:hypothetical protein